MSLFQKNKLFVLQRDSESIKGKSALEKKKIKTCFRKTSAQILDMKYGEGFFFRWNDGLEAFVYTSVVMFGS